MFGVMRATRSSRKNNNDYRLNYCGVCKAIGKNYSQSTRLFLNFDIVFLAELLGKVATQSLPSENWDAALQSYNCLYLPKKEAIPIQLHYAAALNVFLGKLKIKDNVVDSKHKLSVWQIPQALLSKEFKQAEQQLQEWQLNTQKFHQLFDEQLQLERHQPATNYETYAHPSAEMTALAFQAGSITVGNANSSTHFYKLGYEFGKLVYLLDAFRDQESDRRKKQFNPFLLKEYEQAQLIEVLAKQKDQVFEALQYLPLSMTEMRAFGDRLEYNVAKQLGLTTCGCKGSCSLKPKLSRKEKWQYAKSLGKKVSTTPDLAKNQRTFVDQVLEPFFVVIFFFIPYYKLQGIHTHSLSLPNLAILLMSSQESNQSAAGGGGGKRNPNRTDDKTLRSIYPNWDSLGKKEKKWIKKEIAFYPKWEQMPDSDKASMITQLRNQYNNEKRDQSSCRCSDCCDGQVTCCGTSNSCSCCCIEFCCSCCSCCDCGGD
ncbi:MAG: DUF5685 family protein [Flammeovirgaceae bacterium]